MIVDPFVRHWVVRWSDVEHGCDSSLVFATRREAWVFYMGLRGAAGVSESSLWEQTLHRTRGS